jgi:hypothetical protein
LGGSPPVHWPSAAAVASACCPAASGLSCSVRTQLLCLLLLLLGEGKAVDLLVTVHKVRIQPSLDILHGGRRGAGEGREGACCRQGGRQGGRKA